MFKLLTLVKPIVLQVNFDPYITTTNTILKSEPVINNIKNNECQTNNK